MAAFRTRPLLPPLAQEGTPQSYYFTQPLVFLASSLTELYQRRRTEIKNFLGRYAPSVLDAPPEGRDVAAAIVLAPFDQAAEETISILLRRGVSTLVLHCQEISLAPPEVPSDHLLRVIEFQNLGFYDELAKFFRDVKCGRPISNLV